MKNDIARTHDANVTGCRQQPTLPFVAARRVTAGRQVPAREGDKPLDLRA